MKALVCGAGGFIGHHLVNRLKNEGWWVRGVDLKIPEFDSSSADDFIIGDLRDARFCMDIVEPPLVVFQLAADMGGAGYVFEGKYDAVIMHNSALINLNLLEACRLNGVKKIFFSSSACIYPNYNQNNPDNPICSEESAYPAYPDSEYGWEKLFSERAYLAYARNFDIEVKIARFHNIFGPLCQWKGGREKAPAAICRKVATAVDDGELQIWGDGEQTRSFLYIDECLEGVFRLMNSTFTGPVNIGSEEMITINQLAEMIASIAGKKLNFRHIPGPQGVRGRKSDNRLIAEKLCWKPQKPLLQGLALTYAWISQQIDREKQVNHF
jgi:GDP-D-mannose 3', 5'-epimerase